MSKDRFKLLVLLKAWAQEHDYNYQINDPDPTDHGLSNTAAYLTWVIRETETNLNLVDLLDRLEAFMDKKMNRRLPDGMFCSRCQTFYDFAEPNQSDGTLLCYSCRQNPYC